jgi:NADH:ubiquinone oxidoreductase subunit F (NADH-binding)
MTVTTDPALDHQAALGRPAPLGLVPASEAELSRHLRRHGPLPERIGGRWLIDELERAGLTGRGGGRFPSWRKLTAAARTRSTRPVVVANGAEGEPASEKDRALLRAAPHLVLDGLQLSAQAVGADRAYLYSAPERVDEMTAAVRARRAAGVDRVAIEVVAADTGFLAGEASAVVAVLNGRRPVPTDKARRMVESGVGGRPTAVHNVETCAHIAMIARYGAQRFRAAGTADEPGTMLVTVTELPAPPRVIEVALGDPLREIVRSGGAPVLVGGYHGAWLTPREVASARMSWASLSRYGASPGAGVVVTLASGRCGLTETADIVAFLAAASARQCGPCRNGLPAMADTLVRLAACEATPDLVAQVHGLAALVQGRGACHHPDGTVRLVRSALRVFAADVEAHLHGACTADGSPFTPEQLSPGQGAAR